MTTSTSVYFYYSGKPKCRKGGKYGNILLLKKGRSLYRAHDLKLGGFCGMRAVCTEECECLRGALAVSEKPDVPDELLGEQLPSRILFKLLCLCVCVCVQS